MTQKKIIVVFGATGSQGGGLARAILNDPQSEFAVRGFTRDPGSEKSKALIALGAEMVKGDIDDHQSVRDALAGAYGAYFVTFFWSHFSATKEMEEAKNMAQSAKVAGLQHVIWSTLEDTRQWMPLSDNSVPTLQDKFKVPHFDGKGASDQYFNEAGIPVTFFRASYYWENLIYFGMGPKKGPDGKYYLTFPMGNKKMAGIAAEDIGNCAYGVFKKGKDKAGKVVGVAGEHLTIEAMAKALSKALGKEIIYNEITPGEYRKLGFPGADDLGNMFQFYRDFDDVCNNIRDVNASRELYPGLHSFEMWLKENGSKIPID